MDKGKAKAVEQDVAASAGTRKVTDMEVDDAVYEPQLSRSQKLRVRAAWPCGGVAAHGLLAASQLPKTQSTNEAWASLPAIPSALLPQLKRDYQALSLSNSLDPKRFMKGGNAKGKVPEKFAVSGCRRRKLSATRSCSVVSPDPLPDRHPHQPAAPPAVLDRQHDADLPPGLCRQLARVRRRDWQLCQAQVWRAAREADREWAPAGVEEAERRVVMHGWSGGEGCRNWAGTGSKR